MGALLGEPGGGFLCWGPEGYGRMALGTCISLHGSLVGQNGVGSSTRVYERWVKGLWKWSVSLCGSFVKGTWREGYLAGEAEGYEEKALQRGISFHRGPTGEPGRGLAYWDFERWMKGALRMERISEEVQQRGPRATAPLLGTLEDR